MDRNYITDTVGQRLATRSYALNGVDVQLFAAENFGFMPLQVSIHGSADFQIKGSGADDDDITIAGSTWFTIPTLPLKSLKFSGTATIQAMVLGINA